MQILAIRKADGLNGPNGLNVRVNAAAVDNKKRGRATASVTDPQSVTAPI